MRHKISIYIYVGPKCSFRVAHREDVVLETVGRIVVPKQAECCRLERADYGQDAIAVCHSKRLHPFRFSSSGMVTVIVWDPAMLG